MWTDDIESIVNTKIKYGFSQQLKNKYPNLTFTTESGSDTKAKFPCVYLQRLPSTELAQSTDGIKIAAGQFSFQVTVSDNSSRRTAKVVMDEVVTIMRKMHFTLIQMPISQNGSSLYIEVARFRRVIAEGDVL